MYAPNAQASDTLFDYKLYYYSVPQSVHHALDFFHRRFVVYARDKERASDMEVFPVDGVLDAFNLHLEWTARRGQSLTDQHQTQERLPGVRSCPNPHPVWS